MSMFYENRQESFKYELLSLSGSTYIHNGYITNYIEDCEITWDLTRNIIANCKITMREYETINYVTDLIRPYYVITYNGIEHEYPLGTFMLGEPLKKSDGKIVTIDIIGYDILLALEQDKFTTSYSVASGSTVTDEIKTILDTITWLNYNIESSTETLNHDMSWEVGKSKLFVINSLLNSINYEPLFCTGKGVAKGIPWSSTPKIVWEFKDDQNSLYVPGINVKSNYVQNYNKVVIIANQLQADAEPLVSIKTMEDYNLEDHPYSYTNIGRYVTKKFNSEATSQTYLDLRSKRELYKTLELETSVNYKHMFVTDNLDGALWQGDCYRFKNTLLGIDKIFKIQSQTFKLQVGSLVNTILKQLTLTNVNLH